MEYSLWRILIQVFKDLLAYQYGARLWKLAFPLFSHSSFRIALKKIDYDEMVNRIELFWLMLSGSGIESWPSSLGIWQQDSLNKGSPWS